MQTSRGRDLCALLWNCLNVLSRAVVYGAQWSKAMKLWQPENIFTFQAGTLLVQKGGPGLFRKRIILYCIKFDPRRRDVTSQSSKKLQCQVRVTDKAGQAWAKNLVA